jgi:hypothetical protein
MEPVLTVVVTKPFPIVCVTVCVTTDDVPFSVGDPQAAKAAAPMVRTPTVANPRCARVDLGLLFISRPPNC